MLQYPILEYSPFKVPFHYPIPATTTLVWPDSAREMVFKSTKLVARISMFASAKPLPYCFTVLGMVVKGMPRDMQQALQVWCTSPNVEKFIERDKHGVTPWIELARRLGPVCCPNTVTPSSLPADQPCVLLCQTKENQRVFVFTSPLARVKNILSASRLKQHSAHAAYINKPVSLRLHTNKRMYVTLGGTVDWIVIQLGT